MRLIHVSDKEWSHLKHSLEVGNAPTGAFMVLGPSEEIAMQVQSVLEETSLRGYRVRYFLSCGCNEFRVPCYDSFVNSQVVAQPIDFYDIIAIAGSVSSRGSLLQRAVSELEQTMLGETRIPQFVLMEYITPPGESDLSFTHFILRSMLLQRIPIVMFVHQQSTSNSLRYQPGDAVDELLCMLYLCGGRVREVEWRKLSQTIEDSIGDRLLASRRVGSNIWFCYATRAVMEMAEASFSKMSQMKKSDLARRALQVVPGGTGYPLLAIAAETGDLDAMLSKYSQDVLKAALSEPEGVVKYFDHLQQVAQVAGDPTLTSVAHISHLASLLYVDRTNAIQIYKRLREASLGHIEKRAEARFWFVLGQLLVFMEHAEAWEYAADCFRRSRESLHRAGRLNHDDKHASLAGLLNGEALIAYKLQQGEEARRLEEAALAELEGVETSLSFQSHIRTNLGDVFLKMLGNVEVAIAQYEAALLLSFRARKKSKHQVVPVKTDPFGQRAAHKLGNTLMQAERYEEAIRILEALLDSLAKTNGQRGEAYATEVLKTRLALAQAYLKAGQQRSAAACYWHILRHPDWLEPGTLRDAASKLQCYRPDIHECLRRCLHRIVAVQEEMMAGVMEVQNVLAGMVA